MCQNPIAVEDPLFQKIGVFGGSGRGGQKLEKVGKNRKILQKVENFSQRVQY